MGRVEFERMVPHLAISTVLVRMDLPVLQGLLQPHLHPLICFSSIFPLVVLPSPSSSSYPLKLVSHDEANKSKEETKSKEEANAPNEERASVS